MSIWHGAGHGTADTATAVHARRQGSGEGPTLERKLTDMSDCSNPYSVSKFQPSSRCAPSLLYIRASSYRSKLDKQEGLRIQDVVPIIQLSLL